MVLGVDWVSREFNNIIVIIIAINIIFLISTLFQKVQLSLEDLKDDYFEIELINFEKCFKKKL